MVHLCIANLWQDYESASDWFQSDVEEELVRLKDDVVHSTDIHSQTFDLVKLVQCN